MRKISVICFILFLEANSFSQNKFSLSSPTRPTAFVKNRINLFSSETMPNVSEHRFSMLGLTPHKNKPFFCRMEDNLHKQFNVWILFRAGSDADYQKLIAPPIYRFGHE